MCVHIGMQTHRIVESGLDVTRTVRCRAVVFAHAERGRLCAALEVRTHRRRKQPELVFIRRLHADHRTAREHIGAQIQRSAAAIGRNPVRICLDDRIHRFQKSLLRERRHLQIARRIRHALRIHVRAEGHNAAVLGAVCLEALKDLLAVLQDARALRNAHGRIRRETSLIPRAVLIVGNVALIRHAIGEANVSPVKILFCHVKRLSSVSDLLPTA